MSDPLTIEALALPDDVAFAKERHYTRVIFEVDCTELVQIWKLGRSDRSLMAPILDYIRELSLSFHSFSLLLATL
jgi:hypothetical protein